MSLHLTPFFDINVNDPTDNRFFLQNHSLFNWCIHLLYYSLALNVNTQQYLYDTENWLTFLDQQ